MALITLGALPFALQSRSFSSSRLAIPRSDFLGNTLSTPSLRARPRNKKKGRGPPRAPVPPSGPKKDEFDDLDFEEIEIDESLF